MDIYHDQFGNVFLNGELLLPGDAIRVFYPTFTHFAIYAGLLLCRDGLYRHFVYQYSKQQGCITLEVFSFEGRRAEVDHELRAQIVDRNVVLHRAHSRLGECRYDLFGNNCEHFARWCITGQHRSLQVENARAAAGVVLGVAAVFSLTALVARA